MSSVLDPVPLAGVEIDHAVGRLALRAKYAAKRRSQGVLHRGQ